MTSHNNADYIVRLSNGLAIRPYRDSDAASLSRHGNDRRIWDNLRNRMPHPYLEADALWWIRHSREPSRQVASGPWSPETGSEGPVMPTNYVVTVNDEPVGSIGLEVGAAEDIYFRTAEVGYWLGAQHWGKGIMSALVPAFVAWTWKTFGVLVRLNAEVFDLNGGSARCLEKAGFKVEGKREMAFVKNGIVGATIFMGALRPADVEIDSPSSI